MSQVLGWFGLLDFTTLWPVLAWRASETYKPIICLFFFRAAVNRKYCISRCGGTSVLLLGIFLFSSSVQKDSEAQPASGSINTVITLDQ
jgi:hypothetical protein